MGKRWRIVSVAAITCVLSLLVGLSACGSPKQGDAETQGTEAKSTTALMGQSGELDENGFPKPAVRTLEGGIQIQRTPDEAYPGTLDGSVPYHTPEVYVPYNTYYLKADEKGCNACHADLAKTIDSMPYDHPDLENPFGIQVTVQMCIDCHTYGAGYLTNNKSFGTMVHGIHNTSQKAECWNCHVGTGSGDGMQLWDIVKHQQLRGIKPVENVKGDFSFDQTKTISADEMFDFSWLSYDGDYDRKAKTAAGVPIDEDLFKTWTITFSGAVGKEATYTLPELIEKYGSVQVPLTMHCTMNPVGGPLIGNCTYPGIPLSKIFADLGINDGAVGFTSLSPDGNAANVMFDDFKEGYLVYEIDGKPLPWKHGYPVQMAVPGSGAPAWNKSVSDIIVNTEAERDSMYEWNGWPKEAGDGETYTPAGWPYVTSNGFLNKPNVGIFNFSEGQVIKTGQPYEFTGYAHGYDREITAVEFSMDGGATWTRGETPGTTKDNWIVWKFAYTPEEDGAGVLTVRSVADDGTVTDEPVEMLFNAKSE